MSAAGDLSSPDPRQVDPNHTSQQRWRRWRRNPLAFTAARAHSTITSARSATRAEPDEVAAERSSKKRLTRV
jgi:hypothetical protein